jgi:hypothetical protein
MDTIIAYFEADNTADDRYNNYRIISISDLMELESYSSFVPNWDLKRKVFAMRKLTTFLKPPPLRKWSYLP